MEQDDEVFLPRKQNFQIYCDDNQESAKKPAFEVFNDFEKSPEVISLKPRTKKPAFAIHMDAQAKENNVKPATKPKPKLSARAIEDEGLDDESKENVPPPDHDQQDSPKRSLSGILQPATNVPYVDLDVQEAVLDEDFKRQEREIQAEEENKAASSFEKMPPPLPSVSANRKSISRQPCSNPNITIALPTPEAFEASITHSS